MISILLKDETVRYSFNPKQQLYASAKNSKINDNFAFNSKYVCSNLEPIQANRGV